MRRCCSRKLKGQVNPRWPPPSPSATAGPAGPIAEGVARVNIGFNNLEYSYFPARTRVKAGTNVTFTNVGDIPHTARAGNVRVRRGMIQLAWRFLLFQKQSALAQWYRARTTDSRLGTRKTRPAQSA